MRHGNSGNKLGRNSDLRKATVRDLAKATLINQRIRTTKAKAKEARKLVDRLITLGKKDTLAGRRQAFAILCDHKLVSDLFRNISPRFKNRVGGYTRIIPLATPRRGDNAFLAYLELTEKEKVDLAQPKPSAKKKKPKAEKLPPASEESPKVQIEKPKAEVKEEVKKGPKPKSPPVSKEQTGKKEEVRKKEKPKATKKFFGGIKKMFRKEP